MTEAAFEPDAAVVAGLIAGAATLLAVILMLAVRPRTFPFNPLYLTGSAVSIETLPAYGFGLVVWFAVSAGYGCITAAVLTGFEVSGTQIAFGAATSLFLSVITGTTLAYSRSLNRSIRSGMVGDPGPFLLRYGRASALQLIAAHIVFGALAAEIYTGMG